MSNAWDEPSAALMEEAGRTPEVGSVISVAVSALSKPHRTGNSSMRHMSRKQRANLEGNKWVCEHQGSAVMAHDTSEMSSELNN